MIALKTFRYGGRAYRAGDEIEPRSGRDAAILLRGGLVAEKPVPVVEPEAKKGKYQRRDMKAED